MTFRTTFFFLFSSRKYIFHYMPCTARRAPEELIALGTFVLKLFDWFYTLKIICSPKYIKFIIHNIEISVCFNRIKMYQ